jgi:hypothetical protein
MFSLTHNTPGGMNRRSFLRVGGLGLGGLTLSQMLQIKAEAAGRGDVVHDKSVVFLFMHGGPSQTETFDPKMTAPSANRSVTGEIKTKLPGITFGSTFTKLAERADRLAIVRSYHTGDAKHDIKPIVSKSVTSGANMGSLYGRVVGTNVPGTGMPTNAALFPRAVVPESQAAVTNFGNFVSSGSLGDAYAPFVPGGGGKLQQDMELRLPRRRFDDRRSLLRGLDRIRRDIDAGKLEGLDRFQQQAYETIVGGVAGAFDLSKEDPRTIARYDTGGLFTPDQISRAWNNHKNYVDHVRTLGKLMLLARRLCEAGCGFVTVTTGFVWDMHADKNNATMDEGMQYVGSPFDHAVAAFMDDLKERGLEDKILLVASGEMGRTPKINAKGGRDHWGNIAPLLLSGGGLNMGQVIGQSTRDAGEPATEPMSMENLRSTIMHTLLDVGKVRLQTGLPNDVLRLVTGSKPIPGLL